MNKRIAISIALLTASVLGAQNTQVPASSKAQAQVGRTRPMSVEAGPGTPGKHNLVTIVARHPKAGCKDTAVCGEIFYQSQNYNLVVNVGLNWLADIMGNTSTPSVNKQCNYIALTGTAITPAAGDTTLSGEISTAGLARGASPRETYAHTSNATTFTISKTFTATGTISAQAGAVFTDPSGGTMCYEDTFTLATLATSDTLAITWTITI